MGFLLEEALLWIIDLCFSQKFKLKCLDGFVYYKNAAFPFIRC